MVEDLNSTSSDGLVHFEGANDIEQGSNSEEKWSNPTPVKDWIDGYHAGTASPLYNFGACNGCDPNGGNPPSPWTREDVYDVSWGRYLQLRALPEIYYFSNDAGLAEQWRRISLIGLQGQGFGHIIF